MWELKLLKSAKVCLNLIWGGGYSGEVKTRNTQSDKICLNFNFLGGGGGKLGTKSQNRVNWDFLTKFSTTPASYRITDSLSCTTYVETNQGHKFDTKNLITYIRHLRMISGLGITLSKCELSLI